MTIKSIVVVGGGTAGWITAGLLAARFVRGKQSPLKVTLVESENIGIIGVGEGTWPTMVDTLKKLRVSEVEFIQKCDATFKQASKFRRWTTGEDDDVYYHPFSMPQGFEQVSLVGEWQRHHHELPFAKVVGLQAELCDRKLAPKQVPSHDFATLENHGFHLDAGKFTQFLTEHCTSKLGVQHVLADINGVNSAENGDIVSLSTKQGEELAGDLFIDCTGMAALLIGKHYKVPYVSKKDVLFIDKALAVQVPYKDENADMESATLSTAQTAGWIWDIGLPSRRGVGYVFSSAHISTDAAKQQLRDYLSSDVKNVEELKFRELNFNPGHREKFWVNNCVAIGMSSGFLEPLEASALVMIELAANTLSLHLPASREAMDVVAKQYNETFLFRWARIIDFLKLHYVLSQRDDSPFWVDNRKAESIPESLQDLLTLWRHQPPTNNGFLSPYDLFPAASYQYILYGMGFHTEPCHLEDLPEKVALAKAQIEKVNERKKKVPPLLPTNRELINSICAVDTNAELDVTESRSGNCIEVPLSRVKHLARSLPLFLRRRTPTDRLHCVALLGLAHNENLTDMSAEEVTGTAESAATISAFDDDDKMALLQKLELYEPVNLDITFNDRSTVVIKGLQVLSQDKLNALSIAAKEKLEQLDVAGIAQAMCDSLKLVPELIDRKNQRLQQKTRTGA